MPAGDQANHGNGGGHAGDAHHDHDGAGGHGRDHGHEHHDNGPSSHAGHDHGAHGHGGHGHHGHGDHGDHVAEFRRLFWIMSILAVPVAGFSPMFASLVGYDLPEKGWTRGISPVLGTVMYVWGGRPFLTGGVDEARSRAPGMMLLIALAITVAFVASWGATLGVFDEHLEYWWELALLLVVMLLGHWIEMRSLAQTSSALDSLAALLPDVAERIEGDRFVEVDPAELRPGDLVRVRPGGTVPADGRVTDGTAGMDESMITGESRTVSRGPGDDVVAGTVATDSGLRVEITAIGDDTALAGIRRLVDEAQNSSSRAQRLADTAAGWLFWFALGAAVLTAFVWGVVVGRPDDMVTRVITVLVIACPHALGLAIPLVVSIATERAAQAGVLVKDRLALEQMRSVTAVAFDKTGTLTRGEPVVLGIAPVHGQHSDDVLAVAAAAETDSEHPLARAIVHAARSRGVAVPRATGFASEPASGVTATVDGRTVQVGGPAMLATAGRDELPVTGEWAERGSIILHVLVDGDVTGAIELADEIRPESFRAVEALHARGVDVIMITGDAAAVAEAVGRELGIDRVFAGVRPEDKAAKVAALQQEGATVAMVGDGVNDAPALATADVGIAIGAGTDVAIASAGVILAGDDPRAVVSVIELSTAAYAKMRQNLWWAAGYNLVSVPLAAGVLAPIGFTLPMSVGALLMSASTVIVAANAQLLRRLDLRPDGTTPPADPDPDSDPGSEPQRQESNRSLH